MAARETGRMHRIQVFRDHPDFQRVGSWWELGVERLRELHVATYEWAEVDDDLGYELSYDESAVAPELHRRHPGCVLVY